MNKIKIFIDFDGVLINTNDLVIKEILKEITDEGLNEIFEEINWNKLYKQAPIINDNLNILKKYQNKLDIIILTKIKHLNEGIAKINFLRKNDINLPIILVPINMSKTLIINPQSHYLLIDDDIINITIWKNNQGLTHHFKTHEDLEKIFKNFDLSP